MEQKLKQKKKKKVVAVQKSKAAQRMALHALQKQLSALRLKEWLVVIGVTFGAAGLRAAMQGFPSVEPITFFAILSGWLFGRKKGFLVGVGSLYVSNFLMFGGQGPWTIFQALAFGAAGFLGGFLNKNWGIVRKLIGGVTVAFISTVIFEFTMNLSWGFMMGNPFLAVITGIPFGIMHLASNVGFAILLPFSMNFANKLGKFNEIEVCKELIKKFPKQISSKIVPDHE